MASDPFPCPWLLSGLYEQEFHPYSDVYPPGKEECPQQGTVAGPGPTSTSPGLSAAGLQGPAGFLGQEHVGWAGDAEDGSRPRGRKIFCNPWEVGGRAGRGKGGGGEGEGLQGE